MESDDDDVPDIDYDHVFERPYKINGHYYNCLTAVQNSWDDIAFHLEKCGLENDDADLYRQMLSPDEDPDSIAFVMETLEFASLNELVSFQPDDFNNIREVEISEIDNFDELGAQLEHLLEDVNLEDALLGKTRDKINLFECPLPTISSLTPGYSQPPPNAHVPSKSYPTHILIHPKDSPLIIQPESLWSPILTEPLKDIKCTFREVLDKEGSDDNDEINNTGTVTSPLGYMDRSSSYKSNSSYKSGQISLLMNDGKQYHIGIHNYALTIIEKIPVDFSRSKLVYSELFSAPAGECLSNPSPSHILHQMCSARLSDAIREGGSATDVHNESEKHDVTLVTSGNFNASRLMIIDVTTTASLRSKLSHNRSVLAISKYELMSLLVVSDDKEAKSIEYPAIANSLAIEYPAYYSRESYDSMPDDLKLQHEICNRIFSMSRRSIIKLSQMSNEAVFRASLEAANSIDIHAKGVPYIDKAEKILNSISSLDLPDRWAVPPIALDEICNLDGGADSIEVLGESFYWDDPVMFRKAQSQTRPSLGNKSFLRDYPASGIVNTNDMKAIVDMLDSNFMTSSGLSHIGPDLRVEKISSSKKIYDAIDYYYKNSSLCQYAEILRDVAKSIYTTPIPGDGIWTTRALYDNKVMCFYSCRDNPDGPEGYRIDWFAVSSFRVAGANKITTQNGKNVYLWPRQRMLSQAMDFYLVLPHRIKLTLASMLTKSRATHFDLDQLLLSWQRLCLTGIAGSWYTGKVLKTARYLSAAMGAPSSPFDKLGKKFVSPRTIGCWMYYHRVIESIKKWDTRSKYLSECPLLGVPRAFSQLESYWEAWTPYDHANPDKHNLDCILGFYDEAIALKTTMIDRCQDLKRQLDLLNDEAITHEAIYESIRMSYEIGKSTGFGWSCFGSMSTAYELNFVNSAAKFDLAYSRGVKSMRLTDHLTVRHSSYLDSNGDQIASTVADAILNSGIDDFLSDIIPTCKVLYGPKAVYFTHPKQGEHAVREISIADPCSRVCLSKAEAVAGAFGRGTRINYLKVADKDALFYDKAAESMTLGGVILSSDASRWGPHHSNAAFAIIFFALGVLGGSTHLLNAAITYWRLADKQMTLDASVLLEATRRMQQMKKEDERNYISNFIEWVNTLPQIGQNGPYAVFAYVAGAHMGQGMSHEASSSSHTGSLNIASRAANFCEIFINGKHIPIECDLMVTSDDSTMICKKISSNVHKGVMPDRSEIQRACHYFTDRFVAARQLPLLLNSITPNEAKERKSGILGEFNANDTGIGNATPILGFREMICQLVVPSGTSLMADYLSAFYYGQAVALSGQDFIIGSMCHKAAIDLVETRFRLSDEEKNFLSTSPVVPSPLITGCRPMDLMNTPGHLLSSSMRRKLLSLSAEHNMENETIDPHTKDTIFGPLMHVKVKPRKLHMKAITTVSTRIADLEQKGYKNQALMLKITLNSLISSSRTRVVGRVTFRLRNKNVSVPDYGKHVIGRGTFIETTLNWIVKITELCSVINECSELNDLTRAGNQLISFTAGSKLNRYKPPKRKRPRMYATLKPNYLIGPYGLTPFGEHAIVRGKGIVIDSFTQVHRVAMLNYLALKEINKITEHVTYDGCIPYSWQNSTTARLRSVDLRDRVVDGPLIHIQWGDFSAPGISFLKQIAAMNSVMPILALHRIQDGKGHFHCIKDSSRYDYTCSMDESDFPVYTTRPVYDSRDMKMILVNQGLSQVPHIERVATDEASVEMFINGINELPPCIKKNVDDAVYHNQTQIATFSNIINIDNEDTLIYTRLPKYDKRNKTIVSCHRARMICDYALGGYWNSAQKGVELRAYLASSCSEHCIWTGGLLGWRVYDSVLPTYVFNPGTEGVSNIVVCGGLSDEDQLTNIKKEPGCTLTLIATLTGVRYVKNICELEGTLVNYNALYSSNEFNRFGYDFANTHAFCRIPLPDFLYNGQFSSRDSGIKYLVDNINQNTSTVVF